MCMMLYIASDKELPLIEWSDKSNNPICVTPLHESVKGVINQFTKKYVYYIGSYQGCGCGFQYDKKTLELDGFPEELANEIINEQSMREGSVKELFDYIKHNIKDAKEIELYSCWAGNEEGIPEQTTDIYLRNFSLGSSFRFEENQLIRVVE